MMILGNFKTIAQVDKAYSDHLESLEMSGVAYDRNSLLADWAVAVEDLSKSSKPIWML